ncbi:MAG: ATP-dependent DNA helicase, partial [Candidatus Diapherotrites archaeon]|nr:ATP-dependent DNA helicase [Candidatus Diapherotrites archaeon]
LTVFFVTPKNAQHQIAVDDLKGMAKKTGVNFRVTDLVGRRHMCTDPLLASGEFGGFYEICSRKRAKENCKYYTNTIGYSKKQKDVSRLHVKSFIDNSNLVMSHDEINEQARNTTFKGEERPLCSYDAGLLLAKQSQVIICDYFHLFSPSVRQAFLSKIGKKLEDSIVIIDEAQNLPSRVRSILSTSLSTFNLDAAVKELQALELDELAELMKFTRAQLMKLGMNKIPSGQHEVVVDKYALLDILGRKFPDLEDLPSLLVDAGMEYLDKKKKSKSACLSIAKFLETWFEDSKAHVRILHKKYESYQLTYSALDPGEFTAPVFKEIRSAILMSGTLTPTTMYQEVLGLEPERTTLREYDSPFPKENRLNLIVPNVTTKYTKRTEAGFERIAEETVKVVNSIPGNVAVFYPSYKIMNSVLDLTQERIGRPVLVQEENMKPQKLNDLITQFKNASRGFGAVLMGVSGGSISEGQDFPGIELLGVVVVGIPLAQMNLETKALIDYCEKKFGKGWHYGYMYPAMSKAIQAAGRVIRNESDKGVVAFLDERYDWPNYNVCFPKDVVIIKTQDPATHIKAFWSDK